MAKPLRLDPARPLSSLREGLGLSAYALGKAKGCDTSTVTSAERSADRVQLSVLLGFVEALGGEVEILYHPGSPKKST